MQAFVAYDRVEMDVNTVENIFRPISFKRKNGLFAAVGGLGVAKTQPGHG